MMWREEAGIFEMLFSYIGEYEEFCDWSNWRNVLVDILSCHEAMRRERKRASGGGVALEEERASPAKTPHSSHPCTGEVPVLACKPAVMNAVPGLDREICTVTINDGTSTLQRAAADLMWRAGACNDPPLAVTVKAEQFASEDTGRTSQDCLGEPQPILMPVLGSCDSSTFYDDDSSLKPFPLPVVGGAPSISGMEFVQTEVDGKMDTMDKKSVIYVNSAKPMESRPLIKRRVVYEKAKVGNIWYFSCRFCHKSFKSRSHVERHERIHTGEKPFACSYCPKSFSQLNSRIEHERCHTGERPYSCRFCPKTFTTSGSKTKHERIHNRPQESQGDDLTEEARVCVSTEVADQFATVLGDMNPFK